MKCIVDLPAFELNRTCYLFYTLAWFLFYKYHLSERSGFGAEALNINVLLLLSFLLSRLHLCRDIRGRTRCEVTGRAATEWPGATKIVLAVLEWSDSSITPSKTLQWVLCRYLVPVGGRDSRQQRPWILLPVPTSRQANENVQNNYANRYNLNI